MVLIPYLERTSNVYCSKNAITKLVNKIKETGSGERKKGSGRKATAATSENEELVEELIWVLTTQ